jgi:uncharacterized coiled-coil DUF342 family protein
MTASVEEWKRRYETARLAHEEVRVENERLRALSQNNATSWDAIVRERDELRAEIEKLKKKLKEYALAMEGWRGALAYRDEKIGDLEKELNQLRADIGAMVGLK